MTTIATPRLDRDALLDRFRVIRSRTRALFEVLDPSLYYTRPIALRNPVVFYEGHLPAFAVNTLIKKGLGRPGIDARLEEVFARGIDPASEALAVARGNPAWPSRDVVRAYADAADRVIADAIEHADLDRPDRPLLRGAQALWAILEHEEMHQETLAYMWHQVPHALKRRPAGYVTLPEAHLRSPVPEPARVRIPAGRATLGTRLQREPFAWDNELDEHPVHVEAFSIDAHDVTNAAFLEFVEAGGYRDRRWWRDEDWAWVVEQGITHPPFWSHEPASALRAPARQASASVVLAPARRASEGYLWNGMFDAVPLPLAWPVYVTFAEARAYAAWRGLRLPTEAEFHRAAFATPEGHERQFPWGDELGSPPPANVSFARWDPEPAGVRPAGVSAFGVSDLVGNGWEWTATAFGPFPGFVPLASYPEYSAEFFDEEHLVLKGGSPLTAAPLLRRGFRNWFRPRYPFVYATFRCAGPA
jgi:ergothioneine biosynthesis protein EgtB